MNPGHPELFTTLCKSANISEDTLSIDCGVLDPSQEQCESANMECANDENWPYFLLLIPSNFVLIETVTTLAWMKSQVIFPPEPQTFHFPFSGPGFIGSGYKILFVYLPSSFSLNNTLTSCYVIMCQLQQNHLTSPLLIHVPNFWMG